MIRINTGFCIRWLTGVAVILFCFSSTMAQGVVEKSGVLKIIDGKSYYIHTVVQGNTLYSISRVYEIPIEEIRFENPGLSKELKIGQEIRIPVVSRDVRVAEEVRQEDYDFVYHVVRSGETLTGIAGIYNVSVEDLENLNPDARSGLRVGQYLKIPVTRRGQDKEKPGMSKLIEHKVEAGETLYSISKFYGVGIEEIKKFNPDLKDILKAGLIIYIPYREPEEVEQIKDTLKHIKHTVKYWETLYSIALNYRVSIDSIRAMNPGLVDEIFIGEVIKVPFPEMDREFIGHTVERRTRLKKIAEKYELEPEELEEANPGVGRRVQRGDRIMIPLGEAEVVLPDQYQEVIPGLKKIPEELLRLVDLDSVRCHQKNVYENELYRVALMLPLSLEYVDSLLIEPNRGRQPDQYMLKPFNFIQFYEGFMMAVDSLEEEGLNLELFVYDIDEDISKTIQVLQDEDLKRMDLIIGPLYWRNFRMVSNFAEMYGIKIVNPLTYRTGILEHPYVFKLTPSLDNQLNAVENLVKQKFPESKVILVRHNKFQDSEFLATLRNNLEMDLDDKVSVANSFIEEIINEYSLADTTLPSGTFLESLTIENIMLYRDYISENISDSITFQNRVEEIVYMEDGIEGLKSQASIIRPNVVVAYSDNKAFVFELMTRLNELKDTFDITLIGLPSWEQFENLETDHLLNLNVHLLSNEYIDYEAPNVKGFIRDFREKYFTEPNRFAYDGFDVAWYFLTALHRYGKNFENCLPYYHCRLMQTVLDFHIIPEKGFENTHWNIVNYKYYRPILINDR